MQEHFPRLIKWTGSMLGEKKLKIWKILRKANNTCCLNVGNF